MVFNHVKYETPPTKQLVLNNTHIEVANDRDHIVYENGVPQQITFQCLHDKDLSVTFDTIPINVVGRSRSMRDAQVTVDLTDMNAAELGVSHYHAMMLAFDNHIYIKDIDSINGMLLNGKRMQPAKEYLIADGDIVAFGNLEVKIQFA